MELVRSTIDLGHAMGLRIVAEGIEDDLTLTVLAQLGCDVAQGYCISRPMPAGELAFRGELPAVPAAPTAPRADLEGREEVQRPGASRRGSTTVIQPLATLASDKPRALEPIGAEVKTGSRHRSDESGLCRRSRPFPAHLADEGPVGVSLSLPFGLSASMKRHGLGLEETIHAVLSIRSALLWASGLDATSEPVPLRVSDQVMFVLNLAVYLDGLLGRAARVLGVSRGGSR